MNFSGGRCWDSVDTPLLFTSKENLYLCDICIYGLCLFCMFSREICSVSGIYTVLWFNHKCGKAAKNQQRTTGCSFIVEWSADALYALYRLLLHKSITLKKLKTRFIDRKRFWIVPGTIYCYIVYNFWWAFCKNK